MNILLSNDDGFQAPGLQALRHELRQQHNVTTVAPDRDRSGASNSLTLDIPLRLTDQGEQLYSLTGTPTDCVHLGLTGLDITPDIVISGINNGPNLGDDVLYSGTVAAAMEGRFLGFTAIAVSLDSHNTDHVASAVNATLQLLAQRDTFPDRGSMVLNINVPDLPWTAIKGFKITRLGQRHKSEPVIRQKDPRGRDVFWIGPVGGVADAGEGTDFHALEQGYISVTPLHSDLTHYQALEATGEWLKAVNK
ncbi:MAG: 5-nucleotidase SurE (EC [uncultured Thiotrichaceae bacterium]|uniref:5'-nucleotidase SurE n=1 Tax=uncultured Thiotrichaceae bacterium TaxID=298394 RepID=A0A6S6SY30_9GAMM|nr:MAG: 5-nucleotidase SurE (EC [uncultured Thiotrichaceae bacterium]